MRFKTKNKRGKIRPCEKPISYLKSCRSRSPCVLRANGEAARSTFCGAALKRKRTVHALEAIPAHCIDTCTNVRGADCAGGQRTPADPSEEVVKLLDATIDWYRRVISFIQSPVNTDEVLFHDAVGQSTLQALRLGFAYGHAEADLLAASQKGADYCS